MAVTKPKVAATTASSLPRSHVRKPGKVARWFVFGIIIAVIPLIVNALSLASSMQDPTLVQVIGRGQLLLIISAIAAAAIGELIGSGNHLIVLKIFAGGGCVALLVATTYWYADINSKIVLQPDKFVNEQFITNASIVLFIATVVASLACVGLSED
jgi:hypothetical protein